MEGRTSKRKMKNGETQEKKTGYVGRMEEVKERVQVVS